MTLNLAVFVNALYVCRSENVRQASLLNALMTSVDENDHFCDDKRNIDHIFAGSRGLPSPKGTNSKGEPDELGASTNVVPILRYMDLDRLTGEFHDRVLPLLDSDKARTLYLALRHIVREDSSIFKNNAGKFQDCTGSKPTEFVYQQHIDFPRVLAGLFKFSVLVGRSSSGKPTLKTIRTEAFWSDIEAVGSFILIDGFGINQPLSDVTSLMDLDGYLHSIRKEYMEVRTFFDWKRYFQFDEIFVCSNIRPYGYGSPSVKTIENATAPKLEPISRYLIIYGTGGMGKSMMLRHLLFDAIDNVQERNVVPFFVCLRYYQHKGNQDLVDFILDQVKTAWPSLDSTVLREILANGKGLILLDGLDEVKCCESDSLRAQLHAMIKKYPNNQYIMSSRPFDHHFRTYTQFRIAEVCGLKVAQIDDLIDRVGYMEKNPDRKETFKDLIRERMHTEDRAFCENPLLLSIMMLIFGQHRSLPTKRHAFYHEAFSVLFSQHDNSKDGSFIRDLRSKLNEDEFQEIFAEFCAKTYFREEYEFTKDQFISIISSLKSWKKYKDRTGTDQFLVDACVNLCIMDECSTDYRFIHRSFQEYFCACWLEKKTDDGLRKKIAWFEAEKRRTMKDCVFSFLHEMSEIRVEKNMILPVLDSCILSEEGVISYWAYLKNQYPIIPYVIGKGECSSFEPQSAILMYVLEKKKVFHKDLVPKDIPYEDIFCDTVYLSPQPSVGYAPREANQMIYRYKDYGMQAEIIRREMNIRPEILCEAKDAYSELYKYFTSGACPLAHEYVGLKCYYEDLKARIANDDDDDVVVEPISA